MNAKGLQLFASGLFIATALIGTAYFLTDEQPSQTAPVQIEPAESVPSNQTMIQILEEDGYVVFTKDEYDAQLEQQTSEQTEESPVYFMVLQIERGMSSLDIADYLERGKIIQDRQAFLTYVEEQNASTLLRDGLYELSSDQTIEEIVKIITRQ